MKNDFISFQILFLAESHMSHIFAASFMNLPKLKMLDISSNLLKNIDLKYFANQQQLELLNLKKNPWICDTNMLKLIEFYKKKKISILTDSCSKFDWSKKKSIPKY
jgi:Leucine-rich repeat (LRR) protein